MASPPERGASCAMRLLVLAAKTGVIPDRAWTCASASPRWNVVLRGQAKRRPGGRARDAAAWSLPQHERAGHRRLSKRSTVPGALRLDAQLHWTTCASRCRPTAAGGLVCNGAALPAQPGHAQSPPQARHRGRGAGPRPARTAARCAASKSSMSARCCTLTSTMARARSSPRAASG